MDAQPLKETEGRDRACLHASCVAFEDRGILIIGPSGSGKSGLALQLMALGAALVGDDRVVLTQQKGQVMAAAMAPIESLIEARGIGLLHTDTVGPVPVTYIVDLDQPEQARLPDHDEVPVLQQTVPLLRAAGTPNLAAALVQLVKKGRADPQWPNA